MTEDTLIDLAREAGFMQHLGVIAIPNIKNLERFAALVAKHEAEECAKLCDGISVIYKHPNDKAERFVSDWCAKTIRSRT